MMINDIAAWPDLIHILWGVIGILFMGYGVQGAYVSGVAFILPYLPLTDLEKRRCQDIFLEKGAYADVWLLVATGFLIAVWPRFMIALGGIFWFPIFLAFVSLISRRILISNRELIPDERLWGQLISLCSVFPIALFGLIIGNILVGVPFYMKGLGAVYTGEIWDMLAPFALASAVLAVVILVQYSVIGLAIHADVTFRNKIVWNVHWCTLILLMTFSLVGLYASGSMKGFRLLTSVPELLKSPQFTDLKQVLMVRGYWGINYDLHPWMRLLPAFGYLGLICSWVYVLKEDFKMAFISTSMAIIGLIGTAGVSMYPFLLPSTSVLSDSFTLWDYPSPDAILTSLMILSIMGSFYFIRRTRLFFDHVLMKNDQESLLIQKEKFQ